MNEQQVKEYVKGLRAGINNNLDELITTICDLAGFRDFTPVKTMLLVKLKGEINSRLLTDVLGDLLVEVETIRECADEDGVIQKYHDHQTIKLKDAMKEEKL